MITYIGSISKDLTTVAVPFSTLASTGVPAEPDSDTAVNIYDDEFSTVITDATPTMTSVNTAGTLYTFDITTSLLTAGKLYTAVYEYVVSSVTYYSIITFSVY